MKKSNDNQDKVNAKEKTITYFSSRKLSQEKNEILGYDNSDTNYDLGHIYGSW
jgi:hypothetical protein